MLCGCSLVVESDIRHRVWLRAATSGVNAYPFVVFALGAAGAGAVGAGPVDLPAQLLVAPLSLPIMGTSIELLLESSENFVANTELNRRCGRGFPGFP